MRSFQDFLLTREWVLASTGIIAGWTVLATCAAVLKHIGFNIRAPSVGLMTAIAVGLFIALFYLPIGLSGVRPALNFATAVALWVMLAPGLLISIFVVWLTKRLAGNSGRTNTGFGLHIAVAAMILANCVWLLIFDIQ